MPVDQNHTRLVFKRLDRQLSKLAKNPQPQNVHRFRTYTRRVQALLEELAPKLGGNEKKLLKLLNRLRRRAGRVRDLDVQIAALRSFKLAPEPDRKVQVLRSLSEIRSRCQKRLQQSVDRETIREMRKRLKKAAAKRRGLENAEPLKLARRLFAAVSKPESPLTEEVLHQYRIAGKRVRYLTELAGRVSEAEALIHTLESMQDALGDWHDWLMLTQSAEKLLGTARESALIAALRNVTRAKYRHALQVVTDTRAKMLTGADALAPGMRPAPAPTGRDLTSRAIA